MCIQHTSVFVTERPVTGQTALCYSMGKWKKYAQGAGRPARSRGGSAGRTAWLRRRGLAVRMETAPGRTNVAKQQISWSSGACGSHGHACSLNVALRALSRQDLCQSSGVHSRPASVGSGGAFSPVIPPPRRRRRRRDFQAGQGAPLPSRVSLG